MYQSHQRYYGGASSSSSHYAGGGSYSPYTPPIPKDVAAQRVYCGLVNLGNTCFMNSVLQCLMHSRVFSAWASSKHAFHTRATSHAPLKACVLCEFLKLSRRCSSGRVASCRPTELLRTLHQLSPAIQVGHQHDAQELFAILLDEMTKAHAKAQLVAQRSALSKAHRSMNGGAKKPKVAPIEPLAGVLCSRVVCGNCNAPSDTLDPLQDISLNIGGATNIYGALREFTKTDYLRGADAYKCDKCNVRGPATKRLGLHVLPDILVLHLKRFFYHGYGQKLDKTVAFGSKLDVRKYLTNPEGTHEDESKYTLAGVVVHHGMSLSSGHYIAYVRGRKKGADPARRWFKMNDSHVSRVDIREVLSCKAYLLFYERTKKGRDAAARKRAQAKAKAKAAAMAAAATGAGGGAGGGAGAGAGGAASSSSASAASAASAAAVQAQAAMRAALASSGMGTTSKKVYGPTMPPSLQRNGNGNSNSNANGPSTPPTGGADGVVMGCELPPELLGGARVKRKSTHTQQFSQTWCSNSPGAASGASPRSDAPVNASVQSARHKKRSREDSDSVGGAGAGGASAAASSAQAHSSTTTNGSHETQRKRPRHTDPYCEDEYRAQVQATVNQWLEATRNPLEAAYAKALRTSHPSAAEQTLASIRTPEVVHTLTQLVAAATKDL